MEQRRRRAGSWQRRLAAGAAVATAVAGLTAVPVSASAATWDPASARPHVGGTGSETVSPGSVVAPTPTSLVFTYTAAETLTDGVVDLVVPSGWTTPSTSNSTASTGVLSVTGSTISVSGLNLTSTQSLTIDYGISTSKVTPAPAVGGFEPFATSMSPTASGSLTPLLSSPSVFVYVKAPATLLRYLTTTPLAVFNDIGVKASSVAVFPPSTLSHQPPFVTRVKGTRVPDSFYAGAEWCPYCATTTWAIIVALARFGHFNQLYEMTSSPDDYAPNAPSFTFHLSKYTSPFLGFSGYEEEGPTEQPLDAPPKAIRALLSRYDTQESWPFMDVGNLLFVSSASFDPEAIVALNRDEIATHLRVTSDPVTRAIVATANYLSAGICSSDAEKPAPVCRSVGVRKADAALHLPQP